MTEKLASKTEMSQNGHKPASGGVKDAPQAVALGSFQSKYFKRLLANFDKAQAAVMHAQDAANEFVLACAENEGIQLGQDGWTFDQENLEFVCLPPPTGAKQEG